MTEQKKRFSEFYITTEQKCPYLSGRLERKLFTHLAHDKSPLLIDNLLKTGFRRSQNIAYIPYCADCKACISVRVPVDELDLSKSQRRIAKRNQDLIVRRMSAVPTTEQYILFRQYVNSRHGDGGMAEMSAYDYSVMINDSVVDTRITEYRLGKKSESCNNSQPLIAAALCDHLSDGISMVYSYYDVEKSERSLGTYMIIEQARYARNIGMPFLYLGYWIAGSRKMCYKTKFLPQEHLGCDGWTRFESD
ncbi:MAG: arginyltransferase [Hyphomicrobiaceae bacterium]|nr:arginyltransferase [Hyphomicrobiaceae bacterium]